MEFLKVTTLIVWIAPLMGLGAILIGLGAAVFPAAACRGFGIQTSGTGLNYVRATGTRDVFIGLLIVALWWRENLQLLGLVSLMLALVALTDFVITRIHGSRLFSLVHLGGAAFLAVYGFWLISFS